MIEDLFLSSKLKHALWNERATRVDNSSIVKIFTRVSRLIRRRRKEIFKRRKFRKNISADEKENYETNAEKLKHAEKTNLEP